MVGLLIINAPTMTSTARYNAIPTVSIVFTSLLYYRYLWYYFTRFCVISITRSL